MDDDTSDSDSYAGSAASVASDVDGPEIAVIDAIESAFDPMRFDKIIAVEARHSGLLNAEKLDLQDAVAQAEVIVRESPDLYQRCDELMQRTVQNLDWLEAHISELDERIKRMYPIERAQAEEEIFQKK